MASGPKRLGAALLWTVLLAVVAIIVFSPRNESSQHQASHPS